MNSNIASCSVESRNEIFFPSPTKRQWHRTRDKKSFLTHEGSLKLDQQQGSKNAIVVFA